MDRIYILLIIGLLVVSCKVSKDPVPDQHPNAKLYSAVINTTNQGNTGTANILDSVKAGDGIAKIRLEVTGTQALNYLYIVYGTDNDSLQPLIIPTTINDYGTFSEGNSSSYSLRIPKLSSFVLDIAVNVRSTQSALNDVYKIWMTDSIGSFNMPAYQKVFGLATVNFMYTSASEPQTFNVSMLKAGSQSSRNYGSFVSTEAVLSVLDSSQYVKSPASIDFRFVTLTAGQRDNNASEVWLYSPADILSANPAVSGQDDFVLPTSSSRTTYFDAYNGTVVFDSIKAADLVALSDPLNKSVQLATGSMYVFKTEEGKKGMLYVNSIGDASSYGGTGSTTGKNITFTVKVLN